MIIWNETQGFIYCCVTGICNAISSSDDPGCGSMSKVACRTSDKCTWAGEISGTCNAINSPTDDVECGSILNKTDCDTNTKCDWNGIF